MPATQPVRSYSSPAFVPGADSAARGTFIAERNALIKEQRKLEDLFLIRANTATAVRLMAVRTRLNDLELTMVGL